MAKKVAARIPGQYSEQEKIKIDEIAASTEIARKVFGDSVDEVLTLAVTEYVFGIEVDDDGDEVEKDPEQVERDLVESASIANKIFGKLNAETVFGVYDSVFSMEPNWQDRAKSDLSESFAIAKNIFGKTTPDAVFGVYNHVFMEMEE